MIPNISNFLLKALFRWGLSYLNYFYCCCFLIALFEQATLNVEEIINILEVLK